MWIIVQMEKHPDGLLGECFGPYADFKTAEKARAELEKSNPLYIHFIKELLKTS